MPENDVSTVSQEEVNEFLDILRESGVTNMFGARPHIEKEFGVSQKEASKLLSTWMKTFGERHSD